VEYIYTFDDKALDKLDALFESRIDDNTGDAEKDFWDMAKLLLCIKSKGAVLDIGAGIGRLTSIAKGIVREIVALEPDESRWILCHREHHQPPQCEVLCQTTTEYRRENPAKKFDLIVISMVLQHLATTDCEKLLEEAATLLHPDGLVLIFTTHSLEETKGFSLSGQADKYVSEQAFNDYANSASSDKTKGIPVRRFSKDELMGAVSRHLNPIYWRQCSYYNEHGVNFFAPILQVEPKKLENVGRSQFVVARNRT
jgi:2-polyprenyl-3-methyl-5-hydroxy-6-metoxy-1,4-benzoquinol methylase